jgi:hypothetical protein
MLGKGGTTFPLRGPNARVAIAPTRVGGIAYDSALSRPLGHVGVPYFRDRM